VKKVLKAEPRNSAPGLVAAIQVRGDAPQRRRSFGCGEEGGLHKRVRRPFRRRQEGSADEGSQSSRRMMT
jgi:hypothetical protein